MGFCSDLEQNSKIQKRFFFVIIFVFSLNTASVIDKIWMINLIILIFSFT